jgi:hypothetical protein
MTEGSSYCFECKRPLVEIDNRGHRLRGCLTCSRVAGPSSCQWRTCRPFTPADRAPLSSKVSHRRIPSWSLIEEARTVVPGLLPLSLKERHDDGRETITSAYLPLGGYLSSDSEAPARGEPGLLGSLCSLDRLRLGLGGVPIQTLKRVSAANRSCVEFRTASGQGFGADRNRRPPKSRSRKASRPLETCRSHAQLSFRSLQEGNGDEAFRRSAGLGGRGIDTGHGVWVTRKDD